MQNIGYLEYVLGDSMSKDEDFIAGLCEESATKMSNNWNDIVQYCRNYEQNSRGRGNRERNAHYDPR